MIQSINNNTMFNCQREHFYAKCSIYPSNALDCVNPSSLCLKLKKINSLVLFVNHASSNCCCVPVRGTCLKQEVC